jgi:Domain of unknown function (DU1801)
MPTKNDNKTLVTNHSVKEYLDNYPNQKVRGDCNVLIDIMESITNCKPKMWSTMVGFDTYHYKYATGRESDYFVLGFAPSKVGITIYTNCYQDNNQELLDKLGKYKASKACIYITKLENIDLTILKKILKSGYDYTKKTYN